MKTKFFYHNVIAMMITLAFISPVLAITPIDRQDESATNPDGSFLRVVTLTDEQSDIRRILIYYKKYPNERAKLMWRKEFSVKESLSAGVTQIVDWNKDGIYDISVTLGCGAGPNCETLHYNINDKTRQLVPVGTTYGITQILSGYLIDMTRNNCCSWTGDAYRLSADRQSFDPATAFSVFVAADNESIEDKPAKCYFYKTTNNVEQVIPAPTKALKKLCRWYD